MALYLIAVGGTGMRCLESFLHLCAIGMFADKEIKILTRLVKVSKVSKL